MKSATTKRNELIIMSMVCGVGVGSGVIPVDECTNRGRISKSNTITSLVSDTGGSGSCSGDNDDDDDDDTGKETDDGKEDEGNGNNSNTNDEQQQEDTNDARQSRIFLWGLMSVVYCCCINLHIAISDTKTKHRISRRKSLGGTQFEDKRRNLYFDAAEPARPTRQSISTFVHIIFYNNIILINEMDCTSY